MLRCYKIYLNGDGNAVETTFHYFANIVFLLHGLHSPREIEQKEIF
jgi:hypothetical protein